MSQTIVGLLEVDGNAQVSGSLLVSGYLDAANIKGANKGWFESEDDLNEAYPSPRPGWWALVGQTVIDEDAGTYGGTIYMVKAGVWVNTGTVTGINVDANGLLSSDQLPRFIIITQSLGGFLCKDESETITLQVVNLLGTDYTDNYTFTIERDSGDESDDAVWNAEEDHLDCGTEFTIGYDDLNIPYRLSVGSVTTSFNIIATTSDGTVTTAALTY